MFNPPHYSQTFKVVDRSCHASCLFERHILQTSWCDREVEQGDLTRSKACLNHAYIIAYIAYVAYVYRLGSMGLKIQVT